MKRITVYILVFLTIGSANLVYSSDIIDRTLYPNNFVKYFEAENESVNLSISSSSQTDSNKSDNNSPKRNVERYEPLSISCGPDPIYIGPILGLTQNFMTNIIHSDSKFTPPGINIQPTTYGYNIGLSYEERLGESNRYYNWYENEKSYTSFQSIIINLRYNTMKFSSETSIINPAYNNQMLDLTGREKDSSQISINYKNEIELATICTDVLFKLNIFKKLGILTGASFDFVMTHNLKESLSLINSDQTLKFKKQDGIILDESGKSGTIFKADSAYFSSFQLALTCGIQYEFDVTKSIFISPYFIYGYNVITLQENSNIRLSNLNFGVAVHFKL